jgi:AraC family transcriptional regulator
VEPSVPPEPGQGLLTDDDWTGLPLGWEHFQASGNAQALHVPVDTVLVWSGGRADVALYAVHDSRSHDAQRHDFTRQSGTIDLIPSGTVLERVEWHGQPSSCLSALIPGARARELLGDDAPSFDPAGPRFGLVDAHVVDLLRRLETQALTGQPLGNAYTKALSMTLLSYLRQRYGKYGRYGETTMASGATLSSRQRSRLIDFVEQNLTGSIALLDLAQLAGYTPDHFSRLFKRCFGQSPYQYVLARRVERAKTLLRDRSGSIAEIATACGFSTPAHLCSAFKRRTGSTPGSYRRG